jgi:hypothetical protein
LRRRPQENDIVSDTTCFDGVGRHAVLLVKCSTNVLADGECHRKRFFYSTSLLFTSTARLSTITLHVHLEDLLRLVQQRVKEEGLKLRLNKLFFGLK